jgi:hypothetical protein
MPQPNYTMINDLPELSDTAPVNFSQDGQSRPEIGRPDPAFELAIQNKYIRKTHQPPDMGMAIPVQQFGSVQSDQNQPEQVDSRSGSDPLYDISCLQIAMHIKKCPVCSKIYNNDKSLYVIFILLLVVTCVLLLKKLLEKY